MKLILICLVVLMFQAAASATTQKAPVDNLNDTIVVGQLQFSGEGNYTLELDAPQMEHAVLMRLNNLTRNATYQITFTARMKEN
jgi:hypothetical protein